MVLNKNSRWLPAASALLICMNMGAGAQAPPQNPTVPPQGSVVLKNRAPVAKEALQVRLPRPKEFMLPGAGNEKSGGARVLVVEDHALPVTTISISVRAGTLFEDAAKPGVASFTASLLTAGTEKRDYEHITQETASLGATLSGGADKERAVISISGLSDNTDHLVDLLADVILHPTFPADRLEKLKFQATAQRAQQETNPQFITIQLARQILYGADTAYGRPDPNPEQIRSISEADLRSFYQAHYVNEPTTLIGVAGDVKASAIYAKLKGALSGWRGRQAGAGANSDSGSLPRGNFTVKNKTMTYLVDRPGSAQTLLTFMTLGIKRSDPDYFPLLVANYILGGSFNSRLNVELREKRGYTYGASSGFSAPKYPGSWTMSTAVRNAVTAPALDESFVQFDRIEREPVSTAELDAAKRSIVGSFALTLESPSAVLARLLDVVDYGLAPDYWDTYPQKVQNVTAADIQRVTQTYLGNGRIQVIAVGERQAIETGLAAHGPVTVLTAQQILSAH